MPKDDFFKKKIAALLHDSPSKPWIIAGVLSWLGGHEADAKSLATQLFGDEIGSLIDHTDVKQADVLAASFDRWILSFLMGGDYKHRAFATTDVKLFNLFYREKPYEAPLEPPPKDQLQYYGQLDKFVEKIKTIHKQVLDKGGWHLAYNTFYAIYEYLWCRYFGTPGPADTRIPTHTVFDHTYATASTLNIVGNGRIDGFMVSIDLGGVQNFIAASRKLRDLWASSWLTSSLAWSIVLPFIKSFGPDILVLPTARGNPFFYHTLVDMLNARGVWEIHEDIKGAAGLAGYGISSGYPGHAVVPATVTFILPSTTSYPEDARLTADDRELELSDENEIADFVNELYLLRWGKLVKSVLEAILTPELEFLRQVFDDTALNDSPPLPLRVAVAEIRSEPSAKEAYFAYHRAFRKLSYALREAGGLKVSPSATLKLTEYTKNYEQKPYARDEPRFYICSVCGEVPAAPKSLQIAEKINLSVSEENLITVEDLIAVERLCPYCLIKRLSTTSKVFPIILEELLGKHRHPRPPRFPGVSSVAAINFKKAVVDAAIKESAEIHRPLREVIEKISRRGELQEMLESTVEYMAEQELIERVTQKFKGPELQDLCTLVIGDAEDLLLVGEQRAVVSRLLRAVRKVLPSKPITLNTYYAMIKGDGDDVGKVISGDIGDVKALPSFENIFEYLAVLTPNEDLKKILNMIGNNKLEEAANLLSKELGREVRTKDLEELLIHLKENLKVEFDVDEGRWKKRFLVSPAYHASLSRSLMTLATQISREISDPNVGGFVVYSGGDDILAVSPVEAALNVALTVRSLYGGRPIMGFLKQTDSQIEKDNFVPSLGDLGQSIAVTYAHYRYPLSRALEVGINALKEEAKEVLWLKSSAPFSPSSEKDSIIVTYVPRGGSKVQAKLPFRANGGQGGELVRGIINVLRAIDEGKISASLVKDIGEWMDKIMVSYSKASEDFVKKIIYYIIKRNSLQGDTSSERDTEELLIKGLGLAWCYSHEMPKEMKEELAKKLLVKELGAGLQAEIGARRGVES